MRRHVSGDPVLARAGALLAVALLAAVLAGCGTPAPTTTGAPPATLTVFAAASLRGAVEAAADAYETAHAGVTITLSTDSSATLRTQIEQGAPADVFLSADSANPAALVAAGLARDATTFAGNELALIVPAGNPAGIASPADLARPGVKLVAAGDEVPVTRYAGQLLANLATLDGYPAGFVAACAANVVSREDNVTAVVAKIELGEGDAGIVYATDALASARVETVPVPGGTNVRATYDGVVVSASGKREAAAGFLAWLAGPAGGAILARFGFLPPA